MPHKFQFTKNLLLGLDCTIKSSKKKSKKERPVSVRKKRRGRPPKEKVEQKVEQKVVKVKKLKKIKPILTSKKETNGQPKIIQPDNFKKKYCKLLIDPKGLSMCNDPLPHEIAALCIHKNMLGFYDKHDYENIQKLLTKVFDTGEIVVTIFPIIVSVGEHILKEVYSKGDHFYAEIKYKDFAIKVPSGGTNLQKETIFFNQLNSLIPKSLKRGFGFLEL